MKKLLLIPLMTLLCSVMAWGENVAIAQIGETTYYKGDAADTENHIYATVNAALTATVTDVANEGTIKLLNSVTGQFTLGSGLNKTITFDLNGKTLTCTTGININGGSKLILVNIDTQNEGCINNTSTSTAYVSAIRVQANAELEINDGVIVQTSGKLYTVYGYANSTITINGGTIKHIGTTAKDVVYCNGATLTMNDGTIESTTKWDALYAQGGAQVTINGGVIKNTCPSENSDKGTAYAIDIYGNATGSGDPIETTLNFNGGSIIANVSQKGYGVSMYGNGATLNMTDGSINATSFAITGNGTAKYGGTTINISGGSLSSATADAAIYHPQAGTLNITGGTITGQTGIGMKGGTLTISGGTIHAVGSNGGRVEGYNNGIYSSFAAVQIESNPDYAGNMNITVSDDATLISDSWYAFYEYTPENKNPQKETKVNSIAVTGGKFQGGILLSQSLAAKGGFVSGGKWSVDVTANVIKGKVANPISEDPYFFEVGDPTPETAEIVNDPSKNAVLTNEDGETYAGSYTSETVGDDAEVKTSTATNQVVVSENTDVVVDNSDENNSTIVEVKKVTVDGDAQLSVKEGATLMVGAGSVLLNESTTTGGLTVEAGAAVVVEGLIYGATAENFVLEAEEDKTSTVLFSPETEFVREDHPMATYKFKSKAKQNGDGTCTWQRFGIPTFDGITTMSWKSGVKTAIYSYDYDAKDWKLEHKDYSSFTTTAENGRPFQCYDMTTDTEEEIEYTFTGSLMGNSNAPLDFVFGWNYYANSYTAPIDIESFINDIKKKYGEVSATVYVYRRSDDWWDEVNMAHLGDDDIPTKINPMQAFILQLRGAESSDAQIDFKNNVYDPIIADMNPGSSHAPKAVRESDFNKVVITATNGTENDKLTLFEQSDLSDAFDNGYDAEKYVEAEKSFSIYHLQDGVKLGTYATNDLSDKFIAFDAKEEGEYTLNFSNVRGDEISLYDAVADSTIIMKAGESYTFHAQAINDAQRFIINANGAPSAIEDVQNVVNATKFIGIDGQLYIRRAGNVYDVQGKEVK